MNSELVEVSQNLWLTPIVIHNPEYKRTIVSGITFTRFGMMGTMTYGPLLLIIWTSFLFQERIRLLGHNLHNLCDVFFETVRCIQQLNSDFCPPKS